MQDVVIRVNSGQYAFRSSTFCIASAAFGTIATLVITYSMRLSVFDYQNLAEGAVLLDSVFDWTDDVIRLSQQNQCSYKIASIQRSPRLDGPQQRKTCFTQISSAHLKISSSSSRKTNQVPMQRWKITVALPGLGCGIFYLHFGYGKAKSSANSAM